MLSDFHIIQESAERVANAAKSVRNDLREGRVEQEHQLTDRLLGAIQQAMSDYQINHSVRWTAKTLTDKGRGSQEKIYGPDFVGVLEIALGDYVVTKGFLAQSKLLRSEDGMDSGEYRRMQAQCEQMLSLSPASYVFFFSTRSLFVVPAVSIVGARPTNLRKLYHKSVKTFYQEHFACFVGDPSIDAATVQVLERLRARNLLFLELESRQ